MSNEQRLKVPVPRHHFLWSLNESSGEVITHIGPTEFTPSANDRVVVSSPSGGYERPAVTAALPFVFARNGEYIVMRNPLHEDTIGEANGTYVAGANKERELQLGSTKMIPGPCGFPLWPGQSVEVRDAHKLNANEYLLIEVVGAFDDRATHSRIVREAAGLSSAIIESGEGEEASPDEPRRESSASSLKIGQRIVIQGRHTQIFIPPTGIEVVTSYDEVGTRSPDESDEEALERLRPAAAQECGKLLAIVQGGISKREFSVLKNELRHRQDLTSGERAIVLAALDEQFQESKRSRSRRSSSIHKQRDTSDPYARRAVVLGPKNFCFLFDADGNARIVRGPARVFPGPYDTFLKRGSRHRAYNAFELSKHEALWLRLISPISREALIQHLCGAELHEETLDQEQYGAGFDFIIRGQPTVFFPFIQAEVLNPDTGEPHVGNNHEDVIIKTIGVDKTSGIYVRDLRTGVVTMVRGETSYLIDPRHQEYVHRQISRDKWNLWVGHSHPHKITTRDQVITPWALAITIGTNEGVLVSGRQGRRLEVGPTEILLEYDEVLISLNLSMGQSKNGHQRFETSFLHVENARVADTFEFTSSDFVKLRVKLGFAGHFETEDTLCFAVEDPIKLLADTVRARVREAAAKRTAVQLLEEISSLTREVLFTGGEPLRFSENGMVIDAVDVLLCEIAQPELARLFATINVESVKLQLQGDQLQRQLEATKTKDEIEAEEHAILAKMAGRRATVEIAEAEANHSVKQRQMQLLIDREKIKDSHEQAQAQKALELRLDEALRRAEQDRSLKIAADAAQAETHQRSQALEQAHRAALADVEKALALVLAEADAVRLKAIQPELVGALQSASDTQVMAAAAENMNLVSLLSGRSPTELFSQLLRGTPLHRTVDEMRERSGTGDGES